MRYDVFSACVQKHVINSERLNVLMFDNRQVGRVVTENELMYCTTCTFNCTLCDSI
jgi:hypothetical protein